jgi:tagatose 1,6-diphosphate aldolase GatY/KbaY
VSLGVETLRRARREGWAIPALSAYDLVGVKAICAAAEAQEAPLILQAGSSAFSFAGRGALAGLALGAADECPVEIGVHLDHATELAEIEWCLGRGYSSVMYDGSALPFGENIAATRRVVAAARPFGAWVEAELGAIGGDEDASVTPSTGGALTDPEAAERFVEATGVDALAVAVGNVHGMAARAVDLDLERLAEIGERVDVPLVLHGASGLPDASVRAAIALGASKINVNTELRRAYLHALLDLAPDPARGDALGAILQPAVDAVAGVVADKARLYGASGRACVRAPAATTSSWEAV